MEPNPTRERELGRGYEFVALGIKFAAGVIFFAGGGFLLDRWLGWTPALTIIGTLVGSGLSFYVVYMHLRAVTEAARKRAERDRSGPS
jgi:F0F1-type ATP synthase assembly protein I